jgi:hypothetical protein
MFIPLHDDAPLRVIRFQLVNGVLIAINALVLLYSHLMLGGDPGEAHLPPGGAAAGRRPDP